MAKSKAALAPGACSASATIAKLNKASGWRLRSDIEEHLDMCRMSISGAEIHFEAKNWQHMITEIYDVIESAEKLKALLPPKPNA